MLLLRTRASGEPERDPEELMGRPGRVSASALQPDRSSLVTPHGLQRRIVSTRAGPVETASTMNGLRKSSGWHTGVRFTTLARQLARQSLVSRRHEAGLEACAHQIDDRADKRRQGPRHPTVNPGQKRHDPDRCADGGPIQRAGEYPIPSTID